MVRTVYNTSSDDAAPIYVCPGLTEFKINLLPASGSAPPTSRPGMRAAVFATSEVVGARFEFNRTAVLLVSDLPAVAAVALLVDG